MLKISTLETTMREWLMVGMVFNENTPTILTFYDIFLSFLIFL